MRTRFFLRRAADRLLRALDIDGLSDENLALMVIHMAGACDRFLEGVPDEE